MIDRDYIEATLVKMPEIETELSDPATAANQKKFRKLVREHAALKKLGQKADRYFTIKDDLEEHRELIGSGDADPELKELAASEIEGLESKIEQAEKELMVAILPPDPTDERGAIVEVRAGTGGDEAALFAGDLYRMYSRYAEAKGWKIGVIDSSSSEVGGYKEVVFSVEGKDVYSFLKFESGGHRVQRVPVTESSGRIHTSAATVAVFPEADAEDDIEIAPEDIRIDVYRASGPGGQSVNTTDSAVRIMHLPTGVTVQCQDQKSQHKNREKAMGVLKARVLDQKKREEAEKMGDARRTLIGSGDRSERIRTYNFPQNRLTDHRVNVTMYSLDRFMEGELGDLVESLQNHDVELRLEAELKSEDAE